ncbi:MAG TPA: DUF4440 domain-containing protein [Brevundimonas sp.]|jgi:ketosteroid isomerase-like protein|uniref:DUF4440 domain-containing protein n=1 Tax=Brevundimonas sp. TaxID=1871086 RepID=UPI002ED91BB9
MRPILAAGLALFFMGAAVAETAAQTVPPPAQSRDHASARAFMDAYAQDLRNSDREAVIGRYDPAGAWFVGGGRGEWLNPARIAENYRAEAWRPPADFAFEDLAFVTAGDDVVTVTGRFNWPRPDGSARPIAYHGLLVRIDGQWRIRVEDETPVLNIR